MSPTLAHGATGSPELPKRAKARTKGHRNDCEVVMSKPNKALNEQRVTEVMQLLLQGGEFNEIRQYAANKGWELTKRQVRRLMELAYKRTTDILAPKQEEFLARHLLQRRSLYARCLKAEDLRGALQVLSDEAQLLGLYPARKIAPTTPDGKDPYEPAPGLAAPPS